MPSEPVRSFDVGGTLDMRVTLGEQAPSPLILGDALNRALRDARCLPSPGARYKVTLERVSNEAPVADQVQTYRVGPGLQYEIDRLEAHPRPSLWRVLNPLLAVLGALILAGYLFWSWLRVMAQAHGVPL